MKKNVKLLGMVAMFSVALASCTNDELKEVYQGEEISFTTRMTRAVETNTTNLKAFRVYAHAETYGNMFINGEMATRDENSTGNIFSITSHTGGSFFWPSSVEQIEFWAYGPFISTTSSDSVKVKAQITAKAQILEGFKAEPSMENGGKQHKDLIVAYNKASRNDASGTTVTLNFQHALSQIEVKAKCPDTEKKIRIKGAWLMNVKSSGDLKFKAEETNHMLWEPQSASANYGCSFSSLPLTKDPTILIGHSDATSVDNTSLMLVPQKSDAWNEEKAPSGAYILLLCRVEATHQGTEHVGGSTGDIVVNDADGTHTHQLFPVTGEYKETQYGYTCVAIAPNWEPGKKYIYNLEFCGHNSGAGVYPPTDFTKELGLPTEEDIITSRPTGKDVGDPVLDNPIKFDVDVAEWGNGNLPDAPMN